MDGIVKNLYQEKKDACDLLLENGGNIKTAKMSPLQTSLCYQLIP